MTEARAAEGPPRDHAEPSPWRRLLHLAALSSLAVAQPLFDLLGRTPEFFATRGSAGVDVVAFALAVVVLPPVLLLAVEELAGLASGRARRAVHVAFVAALAAVVALQVLKRVTEGASGWLLVAIAAAAGALAAVAYVRTRGFGAFLTVLSLAPLLFLAIFLVESPFAKLDAAGEARASTAGAGTRAPVVVLVMDELPVGSLLDRRGRIDAVRYPSFAALARRSTWFRNATAVSDQTTQATPAILDGRRPRRGALPISADHPDNLFTLLGGPYRLNVWEEVTTMCPRRLCADARGGFGERMRSLASDLSVVYPHVVLPDDLAEELPPVSNTWANFTGGEQDPRAPTGLTGDRAARLRAFLDSIRPPGRRSSLDFLHINLPHGPWYHLPDGRRYGDAAEPIPGLVAGTASLPDPWLQLQAHQRHLLQAGFADRALGRLVARLRETRLWDRALVVVVADHGIGFHPGQDRRKATRANVQDVAPVPLFVKAPGQRRAREVRALARTTDVVPTIADVLDVEVNWRTDGSSAFGQEVARRREIEVVRRSGTPLRVAGDELAARLGTAVARKARLFGEGGERPGLFGIGPRARELLGRRLGDVAVGAPAHSLRATIDRPETLRRVDPSGGFLPVHLTGRVVAPGIRGGRPLAIAVNGRVAAVAQTSRLAGAERFSALVPPSSLRPGANDVRVLVITGAPADEVLVPIGPARAPGG